MSHLVGYNSAVVSPSILKERVSRHQRKRGLGTNTQEEAHLFK